MEGIEVVPGWETILFEKRGHVAHLSLNRPAALNAYSVAMRDDFSVALAAVDQDAEIRSLVVSGQGRAFCAGADLTEFGSAPSQAIARKVRWERDVWGQLNRLSIPMVAAVHGYCIGSGLEIMLFCDIRVAAHDTVFAMPELQLGMIPAAGGSQTLPRNCLGDRALDLLLTGRRIDATEALRLGLVTRLVHPEKLENTAWQLAEELAQRPAPSMKFAKQAIRQGLDLSLGNGLELEGRLAQRALLG